MGKIHKGLFLVVAVLVFSNLIVNASAQSPTPTLNPPTPSSSPTASTPTPPPTPSPPTPTITYPKPSIPEFSLTLAVSPSGNKTIELSIKNQAFVPFRDASGNTIYMVYNVRASTTSVNWTELYNPDDGYPQPSNATYTTFTYTVENSTYTLDTLVGGRAVGTYPSDGLVNFQVEAMIGYRTRGAFSGGLMPYIFNGKTSGWSSTQTINIADSASPSPTPEKAETDFYSLFKWLIVAVAVVGIIASVSLILCRRHQVKKP